jgi:aminocarboxymuconate-semialdehyde decarboxylase
MKVEVHGHIFPDFFPESLGAAGPYGPEVTVMPDGARHMRIGPYSANFRALSPEERATHEAPGRVAWMDERGIDKMLLTIAPVLYLYWAEPEIAIPYATLNNDLFAKFCSFAPSRLYFAATLPMQDVDASIEEIKRVASMGARAINIGTDDFGGRNLDDEAYWPLYQQLVDSNLPIFLHPFPLPMSDGRPDKYNQSWVVGYIYQETNAFTHLTLGGVFDDFPSLQVYITHGGGFVPYQLGRIDAARELKREGVRAKRPVREYLDENFYFDLHLHEIEARRYLVDFMNSDRLVVGSNVGGWDNQDGFKLLDELQLPEELHNKIAGQNALKLLNFSPEDM